MGLKQAIRTLYESAPLLLSRCIGGRPQHVFRFAGGIGDEFLCSAVIRELKRRGAARIWMITGYPELFRNNPDVSLACKPTRGARRFMEVFGLAPLDLGYAVHDNGKDIQPQNHVITALCQKLKLSGRITKRPYLHLDAGEVATGVHGKKQIAIQSSGLSAKYAAHTKEWFPERFQQLVDRYKDGHTFVQVGSARDPLLGGVVDMRGKTSIRETACILRNSMLFLGLAGFLQHLARSVECRSVIIYGGRELPSQTGYSCNENVTNNPECSPCWIYQNCEHSFKCMDAVTVDMVAAAIDAQLGRFGEPLQEDFEELLPQI